MKKAFKKFMIAAKATAIGLTLMIALAIATMGVAK